MKKNLLLICLSICFVLTLALVGCAPSFNVISSSTAEINAETEVKIQEIYALYASNAKKNGDIPLSYEEWLESIKGEPGKDGVNGLSAYEIWLANGNTGTQADFLNWLKGEPGKDGKDMTTCEHDFGDLDIIFEQSCTSIGLKTRTCSLCSAVDYEFSDKLAHDYVEKHVLSETCIEKISMLVCENCGGVKYNVSSFGGGKHKYENGKCIYCEQKVFEGEGSEESPYLISTAEQLIYLSSEINYNNESKLNDKHYKLLNDIDLGGMEWEPIGNAFLEDENDLDSTKIMPFLGVFDGQGYSISNYKITEHNNEFGIGFFAYSFGIIKDLKVENYVINLKISRNSIYNETGTFWLGGLVGLCAGDPEFLESLGIQTDMCAMIINCKTNGSIDTELELNECECFIGGLVGGNGGAVVEGCNDTSVIRVKDYNDFKSYTAIGGLIGSNYNSLISNCSSTSEIEVSSETEIYAGGLLGDNFSAKVTNCYTSGSVSIMGDNPQNKQHYAGGFIGYNDSTDSSTDEQSQYKVSNCYSTTEVFVNSSFSYGSGFIGHNSSIIKDCYASGKVSVIGAGPDSSDAIAGGFIAENYGIILNCYSSGDINAKNTSPSSSEFTCVGGFVAINEGIIKSCLSTSNINSTTAIYKPTIGGLIGINRSIKSQLIDCYRYENQKIEINAKNELSNTSTNNEGKVCTLEQLNSKTFYIDNLAFDETVWVFSELDFENGKMPKLKI